MFYSSFLCLIALWCAATAEVDVSKLRSPCPDMFSYKQTNGQWLGSLQLTRNMQNERQAEIKVGLSIPAPLNGVRKFKTLFLIMISHKLFVFHWFFQQPYISLSLKVNTSFYTTRSHL